MAQESIPVGVIVEKRQSSSPWITHTWGAIGALPGFPQAAPLTLLSTEGTVQRYFLGVATLIFFSAETANYRDNLATEAPMLWVVMRPDEHDETVSLVTVTADPSEGEGYAESEANLVDAVPMSPEIAARLAAFVEEHHVEREFFKRKRDRIDPSQMGRGRRGGSDQG